MMAVFHLNTFYILQRGNSQSSQEVFCQHFRQFCYQETLGPREALSQLQELCCQWLIPENHKKEQILQLLVLEQFVAILPEELQAWVRVHQPLNGDEAVSLLGDVERELDGPEFRVGRGSMFCCGNQTIKLTPFNKMYLGRWVRVAGTYLANQSHPLQLNSVSNPNSHLKSSLAHILSLYKVQPLFLVF
uniref:SCAN box domain-containing protein n=1 Tax=Phocoena sinus TaxID=42100 RepID=A0A8C9CP47_PHOSS